MTDQEFSTTARKMRDEVELIQYIKCDSVWVTGEFQKVGRIRIAVSEESKNKILSLVVEDLTQQLQKMSKSMENKDVDSSTTVYSWDDAVKAHKRKEIFGERTTGKKS